MIDTQCRAYFQKMVFDPVTKILIRSNLQPIHLTCLALIAGLLVPIFTVTQRPILALVFLALSGSLDILDGSLARKSSTSSNQGAVLDIFFDRIVEVSIITGFYIRDVQHHGLFCFAMLASILLCICSFLVVGIFEKNQSEKSFHYSTGLIERTEAFLFFALMILLPDKLPLLAVVFALLVTYTAIRRISQFIQRADKA